MTTDPGRICFLNQEDTRPGPVVYWMQRDQRAGDNWALVYAREKALEMHQPLLVVFCLVPGFQGATIRQYGFMARGLAVTENRLGQLNIPFILLQGVPHEVLPGFLIEKGAGLLVTDFNPLRLTMEWHQRITGLITIPFHEVDAHNIIPCRYISDKLEYAAFTLRKKVERLLPRFLTEFPSLPVHPGFPGAHVVKRTDWPHVINSLEADREVREVDWLLPGEEAAAAALARFAGERLDSYSTGRNYPEKEGQSGLSPYLHFGHLSAQRVALEIQKSPADPASKRAFLEELIVRRELSDNFCLYNKDYDNTGGFPAWARASLGRHRDDPREFCYTLEQFEKGETRDELWNAAQREMTVTGKMHGYMRMYWAKKILEWTHSPEEAMAVAIYLNDRYELDGRDPNGYAGISWSVGGTHDRPWGERSTFGMIRYMNYNGCSRKFDVKKYIENTRSL